MSAVPIETLKNALAYNPDTGELIWKHRCDRNNAWNAKLAGKQVGTKTSCNQVLPSKRITFGFDGRRLSAHRIAWAIFYGQWPVGEIDHINGDPSNNRITNLRDVTRQENAKNQQVKSNNKTGVIGVHFDAQTKMWGVGVMVSGKHIRLGRFKDFFEAVCARKSANVRYGFHENHGRRLFPVSWKALMDVNHE